MNPPLESIASALADRYRIERELGQGGMATVYLAEDLKHHRRVAIKVLRPELAMVLGPERFLREIETTANLRHPHILPLYDSGSADGILFYVMPLVEGESLRQRLTRQKQLPIEEALTIAREVADALGYAHQRGIIHRDIKPENILLEGGHAVVADFGIAKAVSSAGGARLTETGTSVGTPLYMSPEQTAGDPGLDGRSDLYSLGCVLYEMLGGQPPFTGPTAEVVARQHLVTQAAPITNLRPTVPAEVAGALARSLAKNPADRFSPAAQFVQALTPTVGATETQPVRRRGASRTILWAIAAIVCLVALWTVRSWMAGAPDLKLGRTEQFTAIPGVEIQPALSPDGKFVAYAQGTPSRMRIFIRPLGGGRTIPLSDDSSSVEIQPAWSPDGLNLLFLTRYGVSVAPALGGSSRPLVAPPRDLNMANAIPGIASAAWSPAGNEIAFVRGDSLLVVPLGGGEARLVGSGAHETHSCAWSPDGKWIACVSGNVESVFPGQGFGNLSPSAIVLFAARGGAPSTLIPSGVVNQSPVWQSNRRLLFVSTRDGPRDVYAQDVSSSGRARGTPVRITTGLGTLSVSLSGDGSRLAYTVYSADANLWSLPIPSTGMADLRRATQLTSSHQVIEFPRVSPDGRWLLFDSNLRGNADIFRIPVGGGEVEQLTSDSADEFGPDLSPDGKEITYHVWRNGTRDIAVKSLNGGPAQIVAGSPTQESFPVWFHDGRAILFWDQTGEAPCLTVRRGPEGQWGKPELLRQRCLFPDISPDGNTIVYAPAPPERQPHLAVVSTTGGMPRDVYSPGPDGPWAELALWSGDGNTLYFKAHDAGNRTLFYSVAAAGGTPRLLARLDDPAWQSIRPFFATDGKQLFFPVEDRQSDIYVAEVIR